MTTSERRPFDRWYTCDAGHLHWGAYGGAGLLLRHVAATGETTFLLTQRSRWVDEGATWGIPGGAIHAGETPEAAAEREAAEEVWPVPEHRVIGVEAQACGGGWTFHIVCADVEVAVPVYSAKETDATGWFTLEDMTVLRLHPGFAAWVSGQRQP